MDSTLNFFIKTVYSEMYESNATYRSIMTKFSAAFEKLLNNEKLVALASTIIIIGTSIMVLYFLIEIAGMASEKNFSINQMFRALLKMLIAYMLITNALTLVKYFVQFGDVLSNEISIDFTTSFFSNSEKQKMFLEGLDNLGSVEKIGLIANFAFPFLFAMVAKGGLIFVIMSRVIELVVRAIFAPFAVADCFQDFSRSGAIRYLKKILALSLQLVVISGICIGTALLFQEINGTGDPLTDLLKAGVTGQSYTTASIRSFIDHIFGNNYWWCLGLMLTKIGLLVKSISICNDIVGV